MPVTVSATSLVTLLLVSARILAWMLLAPPIATGGVPKPVKVILSVGLALVVVPRAAAHAPAAQTLPVLGALLMQVFIGAALGLLTRMVFAAIETAGGLLDLFGGFALSAAYDPMTSATTSVLGRFYALLCTTLIFATDAYLVIFQGFVNTFDAVPLDATMSLGKLGDALSSGFSQLFVAALQIAGPLIVVLFVADVALGVLNRIAPQLNAFTMSFPVKVGLTLLLTGLGLTLMPNVVTEMATHAVNVVGAVTR